MKQESITPKSPEQLKLQFLNTITDQILTRFEQQIDNQQHQILPQNYQNAKEYQKALENKYMSQLLIDENLILDIFIQNQGIFDYSNSLNYLPKDQALQVQLTLEDNGFKTISLLIKGVIIQSLEETFDSSDFEVLSNLLFLSKAEVQPNNNLLSLRRGNQDNGQNQQNHITERYINLTEQVKKILYQNIQNKVVILNQILDIKKK